jgi:hypothetical protein
LIPGFDGASLSSVWRDAPWDRFFAGAPARRRQSIERYNHSQASLNALARRYGINPKTVSKWKKRTSVADRRTGPKEPRSTVLSPEDEAVVVAFREHTLLPLEDCFYALQPSVPRLTRSSLDRCLQRHGICRLPYVEGDKPAKTRFKSYPIGFFHVDIAEVQTAESKLYLFVAVDRTSKFANVELHRRAKRQAAGDFLRHLVEAMPYKVNIVLADNGTHFKTPGARGSAAPLIVEALAKGESIWAHSFEYACALRYPRL